MSHNNFCPLEYSDCFQCKFYDRKNYICLYDRSISKEENEQWLKDNKEVDTYGETRKDVQK